MAGVDQLEGEQSHERLADGVEVDERVVSPGRVPVAVGPTARQIDDRVAVDHDAHRRANFTALGEVADELLAHGAESDVALARDRDVHQRTLASLRCQRKRLRRTGMMSTTPARPSG